MSKDSILSLLGLCLRGGNLTVGEEPVEAVARARDARVLLLSSDASDNTRRRITRFADAGQCLWLRIPFTKAELGQALGRSSVAIVAVTDIGLANAVVKKLAELDPVRYDESAARLELKAKRAAERKQEQRAHEKNIRTGKYKPKKSVSADKAVPEEERIPQEASSPKKKLPPPEGRRNIPAGKSRPSKENRPKPRAKTNPYAHSRPVKKGKGSFRKKEG